MRSKKPKRLNILIMDDDHDLLYVLQSQLKKEGHKVAINSGEEDLLQQISSQKSEVVLLDLSMNMINGCELCKLIKKDKILFDTKIIIMSGNHDIESVTHECGADGFIPKPLSFQEVKTALQKYMP